MSEIYKLGLSRNRLFEPDSTVVFYGKYKSDFDSAELKKALKMLCVKEPVITAAVELRDNGEGYLETQKVKLELCESELSAEEIVDSYKKEPLKFYEKLFEFTLSADGYLVIAGHTVMCDAKSLLRLAGYLIDFYEKKALSVEPSVIRTFSEKGTLPVDVVSPIVNKLSSELDDDWRKERKSFTLEDFKECSAKYLSNLPRINSVKIILSPHMLGGAKKRCEEEGIDFSSLVYFSFYKSLIKNVKVSKKSSKMRLYADRRFFHGKDDVFSVGAYNGTVCVSLSKKELRKSVTEQAKAFHLDAYRALTSSFRVFSDEILLFNVRPEYCDSSFIYMMKGNKLKSSKNLAQTYGCLNNELCECFYCNLSQQYWSSLHAFESVMVFEPFKFNRSDFSVSVTDNLNSCQAELFFNSDRVEISVAQRIFDDAIEQIKSF